VPEGRGRSLPVRCAPARTHRPGRRQTAGNTRVTLTVCANYGGRWDILNAANAWLRDNPGGELSEEALTPHLSMPYAPEPDLFIRTGGEQRISNFLLWQLAYSELYFTDTLWPDFDARALDLAIASYQKRERRFWPHQRTTHRALNGGS